MPKHWIRDGRLVIAFIVVITACLLWYLPNPEGAAWVQAIGSVGAIFFAVWTTQRQIAAQAQQAKDAEGRAIKRFHDALLAVVDGAEKQFRKLEPVMDVGNSDDFGLYSFMSAYEEQSFTDAINALETVRLIDLGSYDLVEAIAGMKAGMVDLRHAVREAMNKARDREEEPDHLIRDYGETVIDRLKHHHGKAVEILRREPIQAHTWMDD